jgi:hypothetical protein
MEKDGAISSVRSFAERIFQHAETYHGTDPTWGFSDKQGVALGGSWLQKWVLSILPGNLASVYAKGQHFAVRDVSHPAG